MTSRRPNGTSLPIDFSPPLSIIPISYSVIPSPYSVIPDIFYRESLWVFSDGYLPQTRRYDKKGMKPR
jgi:hypothetical protein